MNREYRPSVAQPLAQAPSLFQAFSTADRMAAKTNPWAVGTATAANGALLAVLLLLGLNSAVNRPTAPPAEDIHLGDFTLFAPAGMHAGGSNGGGANSLIDPIAGRLPPRTTAPLAPPQIPVLDNPKLAIQSAIQVPPEIRLPDNPALPNIGVHSSPNVTLLSGGQGNSGGIGTGAHGGIGPGNGPGWGPGNGQGIGSSIYEPGVGGVTKPVPIVAPEAEFSDEARRNKYQGICVVAVIVDAHGYPQNPRVVRSLGMGLDEKALQAVEGYRFKPALKDGKPVAVMITVWVNFRLY